jgi:hypothetical protein
MTILLLVLLVVYFAAVSVPISIRLVGLILARDGLRELPPLGESTTVHSVTSKGVSRAAPKWLRRNNHTMIRN